MLVPGSVVQNRYQIKQLLGHGGMGAVYRAYDTYLQKVVAVKENLVAIPGTSKEALEASRRQFEREVSMLTRVRHRNVPGVIDHFVTSDGNQYLVMDFVEGEDMAQIIARRGSLPEAEAIPWITQVCDALEYLHSQHPPIIHRDIKPQNVKVTSTGQVFLVDFGIAKVGSADSKTTKGALSVTPGFSPPEQYAMTGTDARSDIYSLGATLYALLTGQVPPDSISLQSGEARLVPPSKMNATISPTVQQAVLRAMETRRVHRPQTVAEFRRMLNAASEGRAPTTVALTVEGLALPAKPPEGDGDRARVAGVQQTVRSILAAAGQRRLRLILLGACAVVVLAALFASSLSRQAQHLGGTVAPAAAIQTLPIETATEILVADNLTPVPAIKGTDFFSQTEVAQALAAMSGALTTTATASATPTRQSVQLTLTLPASGFLNCDKIEIGIIQLLNDLPVVATGATEVELTWRVRNEAASVYCKWGRAGQETGLLSAISVDRRTGARTPVKLKWIRDDEYDLSLNVRLGPGSHTLGWQLVPPKTGQPDGPILRAVINVVTPIPRPSPTPSPTLTPCPRETYQCNCQLECIGRNCFKVCDVCTIEKCG